MSELDYLLQYLISQIRQICWICSFAFDLRTRCRPHSNLALFQGYQESILNLFVLIRKLQEGRFLGVFLHQQDTDS